MSTKLGNYVLVPDQERNTEREQFLNRSTPWIHLALAGTFCILSCLLTAVIVAIILTISPTTYTNLLSQTSILELQHQSSDLCNAPPIRREWRTLSEEQKQNYIQAVKCLATLPTEIRDAGSVWDDFDWAHEQIGQNSHESAAFLPWHRYFLHVYETHLRDKCGYKGQMPYWDWGLDWQDLAHSSIWNNMNGFGGPGNESGPIGVSLGHCVTEGPFSDIELRYYNRTVHPHCLSRTFQYFETNETGSLSGSVFKPEIIGFLRRVRIYDDERDRIENLAHNAMHWGIKGDFSQFSATNDPVFYLHHTQLDRLWWLWQQDKPEKRFKEYGGQAFNNETRPGTLQDTLSSLGLAEDAKVADVMRTDSGYLCYRY